MMQSRQETWWAPASASHSHFWLASDQTHFPPFVSTTSFESKVEDELAAPELELDCWEEPDEGPEDPLEPDEPDEKEDPW